MEQSQRQNMRMVFVLMVSAVFCAIATFVALALIIERSDTPPQSAEVPIMITVAGTPVALYPDSNKTVLLVSEAATPVAPESGDPAQATADAAATEMFGVTATAIIAPTVPPSPIPPTPTPVPPQVIFTPYVVQSGDSLYRITQIQNTSIDLMALYGIASVDLIAGNTLNLPIANPAYCPGMIPHIVRDQQTVFSIARIYGSTSHAIAAANNLDANYTIKTTQVLCIP
ncbi:MAG: LysM peptidoglycan-binding domain-containing protein [Chloroflexota bacterium]|jgi:LysM repeat protein